MTVIRARWLGSREGKGISGPENQELYLLPVRAGIVRKGCFSFLGQT